MFEVLRRRQPKNLLRHMFGPVLGGFLGGVLVLAAVDESGGYFLPKPATRRRLLPTSRHWRWVLAARWGDFNPVPEVSCPDDWDVRPLWGADVLDLVACSWDLLTVTSRMLGAVDMLGDPLGARQATGPVQVADTPWAWIESLGASALPVGTERDTVHYLRGCADGIVARTVPHGEALLRKLQRPDPPIPPILVAHA